MNAEERIRICRLMERISEDPRFAEKLGVSVQMKKRTNCTNKKNGDGMFGEDAVKPE